MSSDPLNEGVPLLARSLTKPRTPLPWSQFSLILILLFAESLAWQIVYPFTPQLIRDIGITHGDESKVGYYVGVLQSLYFAAEAVTVLHWGSISDRIGRKPVILTPMLVLAMSMYWFGLSRTFWGLALSRCLSGAVHIFGLMKSVVADMTDETNIAQAFAYVPMTWAIASIFGSIIGGSLSRPAEQFPRLFGDNEFLRKYPYFLPCAVPASLFILAWLVTLLYLEETVKSPIPVSHLFRVRRLQGCSALQSVAESEDWLVIGAPVPIGDRQPQPLRSLLTRGVVIAAGNYASVSLVEIAFRSILPLFLSTPIDFGGLGLPPSTIGKILSGYGIIHGMSQVFFFHRVVEYWGAKKVFQAGLASAFPTFGAFPLINHLAKTRGLGPAVWITVLFQTVISNGLNMSFGTIFIFIIEASPSPASIGATNGFSQVLVCIIGAIVPAAANSLFSVSLSNNYLGGYLVYYVLVAFVCVAMMIACFLPQRLLGHSVPLH